MTKDSLDLKNNIIYLYTYFELPVKTVPARSGLLNTTSPNVGPSAGKNWITPKVTKTLIFNTGRECKN